MGFVAGQAVKVERLLGTQLAPPQPLTGARLDTAAVGDRASWTRRGRFDCGYGSRSRLGRRWRCARFARERRDAAHRFAEQRAFGVVEAFPGTFHTLDYPTFASGRGMARVAGDSVIVRTTRAIARP